MAEMKAQWMEGRDLPLCRSAAGRGKICGAVAAETAQDETEAISPSSSSASSGDAKCSVGGSDYEWPPSGGVEEEEEKASTTIHVRSPAIPEQSAERRPSMPGQDLPTPILRRFPEGVGQKKNGEEVGLEETGEEAKDVLPIDQDFEGMMSLSDVFLDVRQSCAAQKAKSVA
ncbi:MAG: hypothetical protein Q9216_005261 [Gyalolechia sp. 2 TL-2023]